MVGNYKLFLCPLELKEYKYPERLSAKDKKILETTDEDLKVPKEVSTGSDAHGPYSKPWQEYECVDGNHKLFVFQK